MKCPHCNQEHPYGFLFCPITGKKIEVLKACTQNPDCPDRGKCILPLDSLYCPRCGCKLEKSEADNNVNLDTNEQKNSAKANPDKKDFFPYSGITLGVTPITQLAKVSPIYTDAYGVSFCDIDNCVTFYQQADQQFVSYMTLTNCGSIPPKWTEIYGISWGMKIEECRKELSKRHFEIINIFEDGRDTKITGSINDDKYLLEIYFVNDVMTAIFVTLSSCIKCLSNEKVTNFSSTIKNKYCCKNCGHLWGNGLPLLSENSLEITDSFVHTVFSFQNISLGRSSILDILMLGGAPRDIKGEPDRCCAKKTPSGKWIWCTQKNGASAITSMWLQYGCDIPPKMASEFGLSWTQSYNQVLQMLNQSRFKFQIPEIPIITEDSYFEARIIVYIGNKAQMMLCFSRRMENKRQEAAKDYNGTLESIYVDLI